MSRELARQLEVALEELEAIHQQFPLLTQKTLASEPGVIETAAACSMLHSFYTEIEKILKLIACEWMAISPRLIRGIRTCCVRWLPEHLGAQH